MSQHMMVLRGIPGSGKSTFAENWVKQNPLERARVNRDDIRKGNFTSYTLPPELEGVVTRMELSNIDILLASGKSVCVDNMNLRPKYIKEYLKLAAKYNVPVLHQDFPVELKVALQRNAARERKVPENEIERIYKTFIRKGAFLPFPTLEVNDSEDELYVPDESKPKAILLDVDGTAMHISPDRGPFDWDKVLLDSPNIPVIETVKAMKAQGYLIIVMSGREDTSKEDTILSLEDAGVEFEAIHMRKAGDSRKDSIVKGELFNEHIRHNYNIVYALDDRNSVVDFYRKTLGLPVFQVNYGDF
jgi:predicted kinase